MRKAPHSLKVPLAHLVGVFFLILTLSFQIYSNQFVKRSGCLPDLDAIAYSIETDGPVEDLNESNNNLFHSIFLFSKNRTEVAIHLNMALTNLCGRASVPHSNQARYILFSNPKFDCLS